MALAHKMALAGRAALPTAPLLFADESAQHLCEETMPYGLARPARGGPDDACMARSRRLLRTARLGAHAARPPSVLRGDCAVVGNGGALLGSGSGRAIDRHHHVLRLNAAPSGGVWAEDVGSRATLRILTDWTGMMRTAQANDTRASGDSTLLYCMASWVGGCVNRGVGAPMPRQSKRWLVNPVYVRALRRMLDSHGGRRRATPSAGLLGIALAAAACTGRVSLFGFENASEAAGASGSLVRRGAACGHYYECVSARSLELSPQPPRNRRVTTRQASCAWPRSPPLKLTDRNDRDRDRPSALTYCYGSTY